jgi:hypothetical protein
MRIGPGRDHTNWSLYRDYASVTGDGEKRLSLLDKALALNPEEIDLRLRFADELLRADRDRQALAI